MADISTAPKIGTPTNSSANQAHPLVGFGLAAPHFGQATARVLSSPPHSRHFVIAIYPALIK